MIHDVSSQSRAQPSLSQFPLHINNSKVAELYKEILAHPMSLSTISYPENVRD